MRSVVYRYDDLPRLLAALDSSRGQALPLPSGLLVRDGEWVLALFEFASTSRATAAAGKGVLTDDGVALVFERRDWERLHGFASARAPTPPPPPMPPTSAPSAPSSSLRSTSLGVADPERLAEANLRRTQSWERVSTPPERASTPPERASAPPERAFAPGPALEIEVPDPPSIEIVPDSASSLDADDESPMTVRQPMRLRGEGSRVLLVDDDPDLRDVVAAMLEAVGLEVVPAATAEDALELARDEAPDLVVLDWNLPGMSGLEMLKLVRADALLASMPIMFLTAHAGTQDMVEAFAAGADDYVSKPFRAAELGARIFGLLRRVRARA